MNALWWYVARSSGLVAWALSALAVIWGLALSTRVLGRRPRPAWLLDLHRFLGGLTVVFVGVHLLGLTLDSVAHIGLSQILVPFTSTWRPDAVAWGVVALYLLAAVEITSLLRRHIPRRWWRGVHMASFGMYAFATVHLLTAGTDAHNALLRWAVLGSVAVIGGMTTYRVLTSGDQSSTPRIPPAARSAGRSTSRSAARPTSTARAAHPAGAGRTGAGAPTAPRTPVAG